MPTLKDNSKAAWTGAGSLEHVNAGSLQRLADAAETMAASSQLMAKNHFELVEWRNRYKSWYETERWERDRLERKLAAQRGVATRLKNKIVDLQERITHLEGRPHGKR